MLQSHTSSTYILRRLTRHRDLPPQGGYAPIRYKRNLPARGPSGVMLMLSAVGITAFGFWRLGLGNVERRYVRCTDRQ